MKISLIGFIFASLLFTGCYKFTTVIQPELAFINSFFDVYLVAKDDGNPDNDWTNEDLHDYGLFGVMLPEGWTVEDNIPYTIIATDPAFDNSGTLVYDAAHSQTLTDSIPPQDGYYWWGAKTATEASLVLFDSLYFQPRIYTDDQTGTFYLRYAIGDMDYFDRNPADDITDPIPIEIVNNTGVTEMLTEANISMYPNPSSGQLTINFSAYETKLVEMNVFDMTGKRVYQSQLLNKQNSIDLGTLSEGLYFVNLRIGSQSTTQKLMIK